MENALIIGGGFAGMSSAAFMAKAGIDTTLVEKNSTLGGRNRQFQVDKYMFDMGPSWYWMPDVFEKFYNQFGHTTSDFYDLVRLDPSYRIFWPEGDFTDLPANEEGLYDLFEQIEKGSGNRLKKFLDQAERKYASAMSKFVYKPSLGFGEYMDLEILTQSFKLDLFTSMSKHIKKFVSHPRLTQILEFPVLFLGAKPQFTPALYSIMNYADMRLGTWYPKGGMYKITEAFEQILQELDVDIKTNEAVKSLNLSGSQVTEVITEKSTYCPDTIISGADYHHTEQFLLPEAGRKYSEKYWEKRVMAPSCMLFYLGLDKKIDGILHHNLFFDTSFTKHADEIYDSHKWPSAPLFYASSTSKTDDTAPEGCDNLFILIPISTMLQDDPSKHEQYLDVVLSRIEKHTGEEIKDHIVYKRSYCIDDFKQDYHAYRGNAYGLANTLLQTGPLRPKIKIPKVNNLYFTGQLTVPGPGMPPSIISGEVVSNYILESQKVFA